MTKLASPELVGRYTLALAITVPIFMFTNLNLATVQATDARDEHRFGEYLGLRLTSSLLAFFPVLMVLIFSGYSWEVSVVVLLVALAKAVESQSDVIHGCLQKHERMDLIARSLIFKGALSLGLAALALFLYRSLPLAAAGIVVAWFIVLRFYDRRNAAYFGSLRPQFTRRPLINLAWTALPLGVVAGLNTLNVQLPRFFIERSHGERELGLFGAIATLAIVGQMVSMALSRSAAPRLAKYYASGNKSAFLALVWKLVRLGALVGVAGLAFAWLAGRQFLELVYKPEYAEKQDLLMWIMVSMGVVTTATFLGTALTAGRAFRNQMWVHTCKVAVTICLCTWLIPRFGAVAAAWTMTVANLFSSVVFLWLLMRLVGKMPESADCAGRVPATAL